MTTRIDKNDEEALRRMAADLAKRIHKRLRDAAEIKAAGATTSGYAAPFERTVEQVFGLLEEEVDFEGAIWCLALMGQDLDVISAALKRVDQIKANPEELRWLRNARTQGLARRRKARKARA